MDDWLHGQLVGSSVCNRYGIFFFSVNGCSSHQVARKVFVNMLVDNDNDDVFVLARYSRTPAKCARVVWPLFLRFLFAFTCSSPGFALDMSVFCSKRRNNASSSKSTYHFSFWSGLPYFIYKNAERSSVVRS